MIETEPDDRWAVLARAVRELMQSSSVDAAVETVRKTGRAISGSDGIAIVRRIDEQCFYIAEDSIAPLWFGKRFDMTECVAGKAMLDNRTILAEDIAKSDDVPLNLYMATYVKRLAVYPFGMDMPIGALCAYWREEGAIDGETSALLASLARAMGGIFETLFILEHAANQLRGSSNEVI